MLNVTRPTCTPLGPMSNCFTNCVIKSSCLWKLVAPSLDEESKTKTISVGLSPHTEGVVPVKGYSGLKQSPGLTHINGSLYYSMMLIKLFVYIPLIKQCELTFMLRPLDSILKVIKSKWRSNRFRHGLPICILLLLEYTFFSYSLTHFVQTTFLQW